MNLNCNTCLEITLLELHVLPRKLRTLLPHFHLINELRDKEANIYISPLPSNRNWRHKKVVSPGGYGWDYYPGTCSQSHGILLQAGEIYTSLILVRCSDLIKWCCTSVAVPPMATRRTCPIFDIKQTKWNFQHANLTLTTPKITGCMLSSCVSK